MGLAAAAGVVVWRHGAPSAPMSFQVEGAELRAGGAVEAGRSSRAVVRFSDGSEVSLSEGARAHVRTVDEHGAQVTLEEGGAHAYIVHAAGTRWSFDAGPFVVTVTGTAFAIAWEASERELDVRLENGAVRVSGPVFDTPLALRAGQWLTVHAREVLIRDLASVESESKNEGAEVEPAAAGDGTSSALPGRGPYGLEPPVPSTSRRVGASATPSPSRRVSLPTAATPSGHWTTDLADGKFAAIVDDALGMGLEAALSSSTSDELAALADAARYTRRYDVAQRAFIAERRRFPGSEHARVAAFSLGRLFETRNDVRVALSWLETYLMEAPDGVFASEALGRKMLLVQKLDGNDAARPLAEAYLRRFPGGTYAQTARALTTGP
jgi:hypothetical protein